jgi:UPF0755 protein
VPHRERDVRVDDDPHALLFGPDDDEPDHDEFGSGQPTHNGYGAHYNGQTRTMSRSETRRASREQARHNRRRRGRRGLFALALVLVLAAAAAVWFIARPVYNDRYNPKDYSGQGTGSVLVKVNQGDDAKAMASTLLHDGVVASTRAFTNAASKNSKSELIQPGTYQLRRKMKAGAALDLMLTPSARVSAKVVVPEGATTMQIETSLATALKVAPATVKAAVANVGALGLPTSYPVSGKTPTSAEGFLYPATYSFDPGTKPTDALAEMINAFVDQDRSTGFAQSAPSHQVTAYQQLVIASMAQSEAKYADDMAKVVRVILNRLAQHKALQIDAATVYGAALRGLAPNKVNFATYVTPYNTYLHVGLPPTPISNPGAEALAAAAKPAAGNWLYYVNADAAGHLFFTNSPTAFAAAQLTCYQHNWGCAAP